MELTLRREQPIGNAIHGQMTVNNIAVVQTLERLGVEIPTGRYRVVNYDSPRFQRLVPLLLEVPGRTAIEMHGANYPQQLDGCIGVGQERTAGGIRNCAAVVNMLVRLISLAAERREATYINVIGAKA